MLQLPSLRGVRPQYAATGADAHSARAALALLDAGHPMPTIHARRAQGTVAIEQAALRRMLADWLAERQAALQLVSLGLQVGSGGGSVVEDAHVCDYGMTIGVGHHSGECWDTTLYLHNRFRKIGNTPLFRAALLAIDTAMRWSFPLYTPRIARGFAEYLFWNGEDDETEVLRYHNEEREEGEPLVTAEDIDIVTRAMFDQYLPPVVTEIHRSKDKTLKEPALRNLARRQNIEGEVARATLELNALVRTERRRRAPAFEFTFGDDNGYQALGVATVLRWNEDDPMPRLFDDYGQDAAESSGYTEAFGWFSVGPAQFPQLLAHLQRRIEIFAALENLALLIAEKS